MDAFLENLANLLVKYSFVSVFIAIFAGIVASLSPCTLSAVSLVITYNEQTKKTRKQLVWSTLFYCLGLAITTTVIVALFVGISATIKQAAEVLETVWLIVISVLMLIMALRAFGLFKLVFPKHVHNENCQVCECGCGHHAAEHKQKHRNVFLLGILGGIICAPCMAPIILATTGLVIASKSVLVGILIYIFYLLGHLAVIMLGSLFFGYFSSLAQKTQNKNWRIIISIIVGLLFLAFAIILFVSAIKH